MATGHPDAAPIGSLEVDATGAWSRAGRARAPAGPAAEPARRARGRRGDPRRVEARRTHGRRRLRSPPSTSGAPAAQRERRAPRAHEVAPAPRSACDVRVQVDDPGPVGEPDAVPTRRSGSRRSGARGARAIARRARGSRSRRRRCDLMQRRASARRRAPQRQAARLREVSAVRCVGAARARRAAAGHHGGTSWSSATSHAQPGQRAGELAQQRRARAAARRGRGTGSRSARAPRRMLSVACTRHFLTGAELDADELAALLDRALELKAAPRAPTRCDGRTVALIFEQPSTRTRVSFEAGDRRARRPSDGAAHRASSSSRAASRCATRRSCSRATSAAIGVRTGPDELLAGARRRTPASRWSTCSPPGTTRARRSPT